MMILPSVAAFYFHFSGAPILWSVHLLLGVATLLLARFEAPRTMAIPATLTALLSHRERKERV